MRENKNEISERKWKKIKKEIEVEGGRGSVGCGFKGRERSSQRMTHVINCFLVVNIISSPQTLESSHSSHSILIYNLFTKSTTILSLVNS